MNNRWSTKRGSLLALCAAFLYTPCDGEVHALETSNAERHAVQSGESPYLEHAGREIKALSPEQIEGFLSGHGMGLALAAELNGYPGPKYVLELADELELTERQRADVAAVFESMNTRATALGERVVAAERALDSSFADRTISRSLLGEALAGIGTLLGELRAVHLAAHLDTAVLLTGAQLHAYERFRGYADEHPAERHRSHR